VNYASAEEILASHPPNFSPITAGKQRGMACTELGLAQEAEQGVGRGERTDLSGGSGASASRTGKGAGGVGDAVAARRPGRSGCHIAQESRRHAATVSSSSPLGCFSGAAELLGNSTSQVWAIVGRHLRATAHLCWEIVH